MKGPVELAPRVWWVGESRPGDTFQCHAYLVEAGEQSVLIDPGSVMTISAVVANVRHILPLDHIRWIVCHHPDPDITGCLPMLRGLLTNPDVKIVTEWRSETLLVHYDAGFEFWRVDEHGWRLPLDGDRVLQFAPTPYLHFPGAMCSWDETTGVLFSSDLFGGFTDGTELFARDVSYFEAIKPFHEHYMPSREILAAGLATLRRSFAPIRMIAPQHGRVIPEELVDEMFDRLAQLECGIFLIAREDLDIARLLQVANAVRRITDALVMAHDLPELVAIASRVLPEVLPVESIAVFAEGDDGLLRFDASNRYLGEPASLPRQSSTTLLLDLGGDLIATVVLQLSEPVHVAPELREMFAQLAPALRVALARHLEQRRIESEQTRLRDDAIHDALTGLYNRHALDDFAGAAAEGGVLMIDIDHFKAVNDTHGHQTGDEVLRVVAATCRSQLRSTDLAFRYGGEELLVLIPDVGADHTAAVAERIRVAIADATAAEFPHVGPVTVSIGATVRSADQSLKAAVLNADRCLYRAKADGRDRVRVYWDHAL